MRILEQNINNIFGKNGEAWLRKIPDIVRALQIHWDLSDLSPVENMTFSYVMTGIKKEKEPIVLKIAPSESFIKDEVNALESFDGHGCVRLLDHNPRYHALLLQRAIPGTTLKSFYPKEEELVMDAYIQTMQAMHCISSPTDAAFPHIHDWLMAIDKVDPKKIPTKLLDQAFMLKDKLSKDPREDRLLHGDLHHDNILQHGKDWLAIDPKGVIGEAEFEIAAFDFIHPNEINGTLDIPELFQDRIRKIAQKSSLDADRIADWVYVRLILGAAWMLQDNGDPGTFLYIAKKIFGERDF